jgi:AcrR family transcriptional regulator
MTTDDTVDEGRTDTKTALLQAAKRLVAERGYAGTSVRELAAVSGANIAAVNYHFGSREKLLDQAILESFVEWTDDVVRANAQAVGADPEVTPLERMAAGARPLVDAFPRQRPMFVLFLEALLRAQRSPELRSQLAAHYAEQRRRVGEMVTEGTPGAGPTHRGLEVVASYLLATADGLLLQSLLDPEGIPSGDELAAFYEGLAASARVGEIPIDEPRN